jgi:hypothetical protein
LAMEGFFELHTAHDLLQKLVREYAQWKDAPLNVDRAWNFFVTAEHLPDWIYWQDAPKTRPDLLDEKTPRQFKHTHPLTRICSHLASGGKHLYLKDSHHDSVERTVRENTRWVEPDWIEDDWIGEEPALRVYLTLKERTELKLDSGDIDALWLAARITEFWQTWPALHTGP